MNNIKKIRLEKNITIKYIAYVANVSISYISLLERNKRKNPSLIVMNKISKALNEPIYKIFFIK